MNRCMGCGIKLQDIDKLLIGYTPKLDNKYCERCFKTIHYGNAFTVNNLNNDRIIGKINNFNLYTFFITDFMNINQSLIDLYNKIKTDKILVVNKSDLLPKNLLLNYLENNIKNSYHVDNVIFISAECNFNIGKVVKLIESKRQVLFCGETSSGKSTLINRLMGTKLTTSKFDNTTLDFIKLYKDDFLLYDTPGILLNKKDIYNKVCVSTKYLKKEYELYLGDYVIRFNKDINITLYLKDNIKKASKKCIASLKIENKVSSNSDIYLENIGFINTKDEIIVYSNKEVEIRNSLVGGK